jgi:hypothetical protein
VRRDLERGVLLPAVGEVGAGEAGGEFGAQRQRFAAAILERIHFLRHHIGGFAQRAREHRGLFKDRHFHAAKAVELAHALERLDDMAEGFRLGAEDVLGATDGLGCCDTLLAHGARG